MPRFYFNVQDGKAGLDVIGTAMPDWTAARVEALRFMGEILKDNAPHIALDEDWRLEVTDSTGLTLFQGALVLGGACDDGHAFSATRHARQGGGCPLALTARSSPRSVLHSGLAPRPC